MAEETYIVAFDIKDAGSGFNPRGSHTAAELEKLGTLSKVSIGGDEYESEGLAHPKQGIKTTVATAKLVEVAKAESAAEAVEAVRAIFPIAKSTACRAVVKPGGTNFKIQV